MSRARTFGIGVTNCLDCGAENEVSRYENGAVYYRCTCGFPFHAGRKAYCRDFVARRVALYPPDMPDANARPAEKINIDPLEDSANAPTQQEPEAGSEPAAAGGRTRRGFLGRKRNR
jgi:hypothetical protein